MPIEIRELVIRAVVDPQGEKALPQQRARELEKLKRQIVAECMERLGVRRSARSRR